MIDWKVINGARETKGEGWHFPSFEMQEYLLPLLNVGFGCIDEYGDTTFQRDDCFRMKGNIAYLLDSGLFSRRPQIRYDTLEKGIVTLSCAEIESSLTRLRDALDQALATGGCVVFFGD
jgi:hypothetical protein